VPAKVLKARTVGNEFLVEIHLDTEKVLEDGTPDPDWVHTSSWAALDPGDPDRQAKLQASALMEAKLRAADELAARLPPALQEAGAAHKEEGATFVLAVPVSATGGLSVAEPPAESKGDAGAQGA
jgi:hypothetical protein